MRYALVTGGSRGLGRAVCIKLAQQGIPVVINYQSNIKAAEEVKEIIISNGGIAELLPFNVSDKMSVDEALETLKKAGFIAEGSMSLKDKIANARKFNGKDEDNLWNTETAMTYAKNIAKIAKNEKSKKNEPPLGNKYIKSTPRIIMTIASIRPIKNPCLKFLFIP